MPPPPKAGAGKGLNKKIAGVPAKYLLAAAVAVVGYLLYRHFRAQGSSSAGSTATPQEPTLQPSAPQDSLGGGASGGGGDVPPPDTSALDAAQQQLQDLVSSLLGAAAPAVQPPLPTSTFPLAPATPQTPDTGGGNTSPPPPPAPAPSATGSSFPQTFANTLGVTSTIPGTAGSTMTTFTPKQIQTINTSPNVLRTVGSDAAQSISNNVRYYTYRAQVPLGRGQTVHFRTGRGYYAA